MSDFLRTALESTNAILTAGIVIIAASLLLYNLSRNLRNRVTRTSSAVLASVTIVYIGDVLVALQPTLGTFESLLRMQWIGLALIPIATFHLSDALLATTGLPSRGRRKRIIRILYAISIAFIILAVFTESLITTATVDDRVSVRAAFLFPLFMAYYVPVNLIALFNVWRARQRCLTRSTQRRMTYLLIALLTPSVGIFPYSVILPAGQEFSIVALALVTMANIVVILMLLLLAYPLSFFGSRLPDRVVKADLLRFMMLGPGTGMLALAVIQFTEPTTEIIGVIGRDFMPFAVVAVILMWQWLADVILPTLEQRLIYNAEDDEQLTKLQNLSDKLLTRTDMVQLLEATLESTCDYLRVDRAFVATLINRTPEFVMAVGTVEIDGDEFNGGIDSLVERFHEKGRESVEPLASFWVLPLYSRRMSGETGDAALIGMMGVDQQAQLDSLDEEAADVMGVFIRRTARVLDDLLLQTEIYAALEGLLPQFSVTRSHAAEVEYRPGRDGVRGDSIDLPERDQVIEQVRAALRHYWGGPGLSNSRLVELQIVQQNLEDGADNGVKALRDVLVDAIDRLKPDGERDFKSPEWLLYNILTQRFIDSRKAKDTARRLYISEANLYRKQNAAIEAVADAILDMEREEIDARRGVPS